MEVIEDIKPIFMTDNVLEILSESVYCSSKEKLIHLAEEFITNKNILLLGHIFEGYINGVLVLDVTKINNVEILHIAVKSNRKNLGIGTKLINFVVSHFNPDIVVAETDDDSVGFYRRLGFEVINLGEKYPNVIRYQCKLKSIKT